MAYPGCCVVRASIALPPGRSRFWATCGVTFQVSALGHEIRRVVCLVATLGHLLRSRNLFQHHHRRIALCRSVGLAHLGVYDLYATVLIQQLLTYSSVS